MQQGPMRIDLKRMLQLYVVLVRRCDARYSLFTAHLQALMVICIYPSPPLNAVLLTKEHFEAPIKVFVTVS